MITYDVDYTVQCNIYKIVKIFVNRIRRRSEQCIVLSIKEIGRKS